MDENDPEHRIVFRTPNNPSHIFGADLMNAKFLSSVLSLFILFGWATFASAQNVLLFTFDDSGPNVTATVTGSFDTSGLNSSGQTAPRAPDAFRGATATFLTFGTTTATNVDLFNGVNVLGGPLVFFPHLTNFPISDQGPPIVTPLSEYLEINVATGLGFDFSSIGLAEGQTIFDGDALENNVIVFQQSSLEDLGDSSFLSTTPIAVLSDPSGENTIQFVLAAPEIILGDVNQDTYVDLFDIAPFIGYLITGSFLEEADVNQDDAVNLFDILPFIEILTAG